MAEPATQVTFPVKSCSGAKLHRSIVIARVGYVNRDGYRTFNWPFLSMTRACANVELICSAICIADYKSMGHYLQTQA